MAFPLDEECASHWGLTRRCRRTADIPRAHLATATARRIAGSDRGAAEGVVLAERFASASTRKVKGLFRDLCHNSDGADYELGRAVLAGDHAWLEEGGVGLGLSAEHLAPRPPTAPAKGETGRKATPAEVTCPPASRKEQEGAPVR
jgi:hypothetical protein